MLAILRKELKTYFTSVFLYLYYAVFFVVAGVFFSSACLTFYSTQFGYYVLNQCFFVVAAVIPFCTMRLFAQERRSKTDQLLFTAPVSTFAILMGKFLATVIAVLLPVFLSVIYPCIISSCGEMSVKLLMGSYIGVILVSLVFLSAGMFISTLTTNSVLAAVISYAFYGMIMLSRLIESLVEGSERLYDIFHNLSIYNKLNDMVSGIVRSGDVLYLLLLMVCFFLLTWIALESRRQNKTKIIMYALTVVIVSGTISMFSLSHTKVFDFTAERLLTLSEETKESVSKISSPTDIYYMGTRSRANATYQEFLDAYQNLNNNIAVQYKNYENDLAFRQQYLSDVNFVNESSILVVCNDKYIYLDAENYVTTTQATAYSYESMLEIEDQLTRAICYVNSETEDKICMVAGHGEEELNSDFRNLMMLNNYEMKDLNLPAVVTSFETSIPEDCKALFINSPQTDFSEEEIEVLKNYLKDGGRLLVTLDPLNEDITRFYDFLREYGLDVQPGIVIEQDAGRYVYDTPYYLAPKIEDTQYTKDILDMNLTVLTMTSKGILKKGQKNGYISTDILTTGTKAYSKVEDFDNLTTKDDEDIMGPFSVASCSENPEEGSIFLLTSNVFFNEDADAESGGANRKFFVEITKQLTGSQSSVWVEGKNVGAQVALYPSSMQKVLKVLTMIIIPILILCIGMIVLLLRHKNFSIYALKKEDKKENEE